MLRDSSKVDGKDYDTLKRIGENLYKTQKALGVDNPKLLKAPGAMDEPASPMFGDKGRRSTALNLQALKSKLTKKGPQIDIESERLSTDEDEEPPIPFSSLLFNFSSGYNDPKQKF